MKIKILKILEEKKPFEPQGKFYKIFEFAVKGELDGVLKDYLILKSFTKNRPDIKENIEVNVDEQTNQYGTCYIIQKEKQDKKWGGYSKPTYTQREYDLLFSHAFNVIKPFVKIVDNPFERLQVTSSLLATYLISAANAGVKIEQLDKKLDKKDPAKKFVDDHKEDQETDENMTDIFNDDDIEF